MKSSSLWITKGGQGVDGWGVRQCTVMCCTMHHPHRPAGLRSTLQSLCLFRLCLHSLRSQSELTRLPPLDFFPSYYVQFSFLFILSEASPETAQWAVGLFSSCGIRAASCCQRSTTITIRSGIQLFWHPEDRCRELGARVLSLWVFRQWEERGQILSEFPKAAGSKVTKLFPVNRYWCGYLNKIHCKKNPKSGPQWIHASCTAFAVNPEPLESNITVHFLFNPLD